MNGQEQGVIPPCFGLDCSSCWCEGSRRAGSDSSLPWVRLQFLSVWRQQECREGSACFQSLPLNTFSGPSCWGVGCAFSCECCNNDIPRDSPLALVWRNWADLMGGDSLFYKHKLTRLPEKNLADLRTRSQPEVAEIWESWGGVNIKFNLLHMWRPIFWRVRICQALYGDGLPPRARGKGAYIGTKEKQGKSKKHGELIGNMECKTKEEKEFDLTAPDLRVGLGPVMEEGTASVRSPRHLLWRRSGEAEPSIKEMEREPPVGGVIPPPLPGLWASIAALNARELLHMMSWRCAGIEPESSGAANPAWLFLQSGLGRTDYMLQQKQQSDSSKREGGMDIEEENEETAALGRRRRGKIARRAMREHCPIARCTRAKRLEPVLQAARNQGPMYVKVPYSLMELEQWKATAGKHKEKTDKVAMLMERAINSRNAD